MCLTQTHSWEPLSQVLARQSPHRNHWLEFEGNGTQSLRRRARARALRKPVARWRGTVGLYLQGTGACEGHWREQRIFVLANPLDKEGYKEDRSKSKPRGRVDGGSNLGAIVG